jgi:hypothetical protein
MNLTISFRCVRDMRTSFETEFDRRNQLSLDGESRSGRSGARKAIPLHPALTVGQTSNSRHRPWSEEEGDCAEFLLADQSGMPDNEQLSTRSDVGDHSIAICGIRHMATALEMDAHNLDKRLRDWLIILKDPIGSSRWALVKCVSIPNQFQVNL